MYFIKDVYASDIHDYKRESIKDISLFYRLSIMRYHLLVEELEFAPIVDEVVT